MSPEMKVLLLAIVEGKQMQQLGAFDVWKDCSGELALYRVSQGMLTRIKPAQRFREVGYINVFENKVFASSLDATRSLGVNTKFGCVRIMLDPETGELKTAAVVS